MQIDESELETVRGKIIGIGRVKIPKLSNFFEYELPLLSFVVIKRKDDGYVSSCIHLQIDGYGKSVDEAQVDMLDNVLYYLDVNFNDEHCKGNCWVNIFELFKSNESSSDLWDKYHAFQIMLAEKGHAADQLKLMEKIGELEQKVRELEAQIADMKDQRSKFLATLKNTGKMPIVQYIPENQRVA
jgi:hypothetical protein